MTIGGLFQHLELGRALCADALEAADNGAGLTIDLTGGGYRGLYPAGPGSPNCTWRPWPSQDMRDAS
jgi:hypothetical protein